MSDEQKYSGTQKNINSGQFFLVNRLLFKVGDRNLLLPIHGATPGPDSLLLLPVVYLAGPLWVLLLVKDLQLLSLLDVLVLLGLQQ